MQLTEETYRALARSSPWRWRTLHFTYATGREDVEAWLRRPGQLLVRRPGERDLWVDERESLAGGGRGVLVSAGLGLTPLEPPPLRWPHEVEPALRPDGLVAERPSDFEVAYDDPMFQSYDWVAVLDPVELSHHTSVTDLRESERRGRRTWWAVVRPEEGYEPRCGCCPLLWSAISDRDEYSADEDEAWRPSPGTIYPEAYDVALDVQTGVVVEVDPVGASSTPSWDRLGILEVDADMDELFAGRRRGLRRRR